MITEKDIPGLRQLWQQAFGDSDDLLDKFFSAGFSPNRCNCIRSDDKIVAALYWFDCRWRGKKVAYIYAVATHEAYRGRGLCRSLMEDTHLKLREQGYSGAVLVPAGEGLVALYAKFGYRSFCSVEEITASMENTPAAAKITPTEYARLRRSFLGENAIFQDSIAFDFLATYGAFYKTPGGIYCGYQEENSFHFEEILGEDAPDAEALLEAMYLSLTGEDALPAYFAIPLS